MSDDNDVIDVKSCILRVSQIDCTLADARFHLILSNKCLFYSEDLHESILANGHWEVL